MSNLLDQWNEHIIRGNQLSRELEDFEGIIGAGQEQTSEIAFVEKGIGTTYISVLSQDKMAEFKQMVLQAIMDAREEKEIELKKLMGVIPVLPSLAQGGVIIGAAGQGKSIMSMLYTLPSDAPEVVIPDPITKRKPATINPEFEAAVEEMERKETSTQNGISVPETIREFIMESKEQELDPIKEKLTDILSTEAKRIEDKPIETDPSLDNYPAKHETRKRLPESMTEEAVYHMLVIKKMKPKEIAAHYGLTGTQVSNYIFQHDIRNYGKKHKLSADKQPDAKERP